MITEKAEAFKRISTSRVPKAVKSIALLENLSGSNYHYSIEEARELVGEIRSAADSLAAAFKISSPASAQVSKSPGEIVKNPPGDPETLEQLDPDARSWVAWSLDTLQHGDRSEAIAMLKKGLTIQRNR